MSIEQIICEIEKATPIGPSTNARPKTENSQRTPMAPLTCWKYLPTIELILFTATYINPLMLTVPAMAQRKVTPK